MDLIDRAALIRRLKDHADGTSFLYKSAILTAVMFAEEQPTIEAVPLDKLCEWLAEHSVNIPCETCRNFSNGYCMAIGDMNQPCPNKAEDWQRAIKEWMEGQHD